MATHVPDPASPACSFTLEDLGAMPDAMLRRMVLAIQELPSVAEGVTTEFGRPTTEAFIVEVLGEQPTETARSYGITVPWWAGQEAVMKAFRENDKTAVHSGNSVGKTWTAACVALSALYETENTIVITTAPNARQVETLMWGEIRDMRSRSKTKLPGTGLLTSIKLNEKWYAMGYTARVRVGDSSVTGFQGSHGKGEKGRVVVIVDEATDIPVQMWQAFGRITTGEHDKILAIGNVTDPAAYFTTIGDLKRPDGTPIWKLLVLNGEDHPNIIHDNAQIIPGAITTKFIRDVLDETGSRESSYYRSAVLGLAPKENPDGLIGLEAVRASQRKLALIQEGQEKHKATRRGRAIGVDVAGTGTDLTILSTIFDDVWEIPQLPNPGDVPKLKVEGLDYTKWGGKRTWLQGRDPMEVAELIQAACWALQDVRVICLDDTGIGQGVSARLRQLQREGKLPKYRMLDGKTREIWILPRNFGAASEKSIFDLVKDEMWWGVREAIRAVTLLLPTEQTMAKWELPRGNHLVAQLTTPIYGRVGSGGEDGKKIQVYDKRGAHGKVMLTRNLPSKSPDIAHSCMLAWNGWSHLRADKADSIAPPRNLQEAFDQKTRELMNKGAETEKRKRQSKAHTKAGKGPVAPWARRGNSGKS